MKDYNLQCTMCGNTVRCDKETYKTAPMNINGSKIFICGCCEDDMFAVYRKRGDIRVEHKHFND